MIKILNNGSIYNEIANEKAKGLFLLLYRSKDKIEIIYPEKDNHYEILHAYYSFIIEENNLLDFFGVIFKSFPKMNFANYGSTPYLCYKDENFSCVFAFTVDDSNFFRLANPSTLIKYL